MDSNVDPEARRSARETLKKMEHPKMQKIQNDFIRTLNVNIPSEYRLTFIKSWELFTNKNGIYKEILNRKESKFNKPERLYGLINSEIQEKIHTIYYHLKNAINYQEIIDKYCEEILNISKEIGMDWPITISLGVNKLHYEYEAFIIQCASCLERVIISISYYYKSHAYKIESLDNILKDISDRDKKAYMIREILNKSWNFINVLKSRGRIDLGDRDIIAHRGVISLRPLNIMINPISGSKILQLAKHNDEKDWRNLPSLVTSMKQIMNEFIQFINEIFGVFFA